MHTSTERPTIRTRFGANKHRNAHPSAPSRNPRSSPNPFSLTSLCGSPPYSCFPPPHLPHPTIASPNLPILSRGATAAAAATTSVAPSRVAHAATHSPSPWNPPLPSSRRPPRHPAVFRPNEPPVVLTASMSHLRYGIVGLRAGFIRQDSRPLAFIPVKAHRYARLEGTRLSLAKGPNGEVIWSFDIAGSLVESSPEDRKITIYIVDSQRRRRRVMVLSASDRKNYQRWSLWLIRASKSVLEMHYSMDRLISKGAFARVVLGSDLHTGESVAIKLIEKSNAPPSERKYFEREMKIMQTLSHPNIVQCYDVFDNRLRTRIVMEYIQGGTLGDVISTTSGSLPEEDSKRLMRDILRGVEYIHDMGTIHRDLKPDNCLLTSSEPPYGTVKLSDFGLSNVVTHLTSNGRGHVDEHCVLTSAVGSPGFVAPEVFGSCYGTAVDIWSCGVILFMMLSGGVMPFPGKSGSEIVRLAKNGKLDLRSDSLRQASAEAKSLVRGLLNVDDKERFTAKEALEHPWLSNVSDSSSDKSSADDTGSSFAS